MGLSPKKETIAVKKRATDSRTTKPAKKVKNEVNAPTRASSRQKPKVHIWVCQVDHGSSPNDVLITWQAWHAMTSLRRVCVLCMQMLDVWLECRHFVTVMKSNQRIRSIYTICTNCVPCKGHQVRDAFWLTNENILYSQVNYAEEKVIEEEITVAPAGMLKRLSIIPNTRGIYMLWWAPQVFWQRS